MPDNAGTYLKVKTAVVWAMQEAALKALQVHWSLQLWSGHSGCSPGQSVGHLYDLGRLASSQQADPTLSLVISRLWDGTLEWWQPKLTDPPKFSLFLQEWNHLVLKRGILYRWARPRVSEETLFQLVLPATQREVALKGCHDQVGHLGLKCMLDLMPDQFFWPCMAAQAKEHIRKCHPCLALKPSSPRLPWKYHGHTSLGACPPRLPVSGTRERSRIVFS